jgi:trimeric autotransporter adhesin
MNKLVFLLVMVMAGLLAGCGSSSNSATRPPAALESISVTAANSAIPLGTLTQFKATGVYSDQSTQDLTATAQWTSSNPAVTAIAAGGLATALNITPAPITITATSGGVSGNMGLTVAAATLTSIAISGAPTVTIAKGTSYLFSALGSYNDGSTRNITSQVGWSSSMTNVATISATTGLAQSVGTGTTTITATLGTVTANASLDVTGATLTSIVVAPSGATIAPLTTKVFTAIGIFSDSSTQIITHDAVWASSSAAATISNLVGSIGSGTGVTSGPANISAAFGGVTGSATLNVSSATPTSLAVTPASAGLAAGTNLGLQAIATFSDGSTQRVETVANWTTSAMAVATVSADGYVTGISNGPVTITCQFGGLSSAANLTVEPLTSIAISSVNTGVAEGTSITLVATGTLADMTTQKLTNSVFWTSSNPSVTTLSDAVGSSFGSATGNAPGSATVTAAFPGVVGVAPLTVTNATLSSIAIKPASPDVAAGSPQQFTATGTFSDSTTENLVEQVAWSSSDLSVAIIDKSGAALTTGTGTTTIGATLGAVSDTTVLTVH